MNSYVCKPICIDLSIGDQLTSISCGHIVVELIKFIAYQRQQIPYAYPWLKQVINKKKESYDEDVKESFHSDRHFRIASAALENLDFILKGLLQEINGSAMPDEVCIALGTTPVTCREVYRLVMPTACHKPQCHSNLIATDQKIQRNVFRALVTAEKLSEVFFNTLQPTNLYVFIQKKMMGTQEAVLSSDTFLYTSGCRIPRNSKIVVIDFRSANQDRVKCCNEFQIYGDIKNKTTQLSFKTDNEVNELHDIKEFQDIDELHEIESTDTAKWYQSSYVMKGFKDCIVNGSSVTNTWQSS